MATHDTDETSQLCYTRSEMRIPKHSMKTEKKPLRVSFPLSALYLMHKHERFTLLMQAVALCSISVGILDSPASSLTAVASKIDTEHRDTKAAKVELIKNNEPRGLLM